MFSIFSTFGSLAQNRWALRRGVFILTMLTLLISLLYEIPQSIQIVVFVLSIVFLGIPHGAVDYLIHKYTPSNLSFSHFAVKYVAVMVFYAVVWYFFPTFSLFIFILLATLHFGQSQLYYLKLADNRLLKWTIYFTWGRAVLGGIIFGSW